MPSLLLSSCSQLQSSRSYQDLQIPIHFSSCSYIKSIPSAVQSKRFAGFVVLPHLTRAGLCWWLAKHSFAAEHVLGKPLCSQSSTFSTRETWTQCSSACTAHHGFYFRQYNPAYEQVLALQGQAPRLQHQGWMALATPALNLAAAEVSNKQDTAETDSLFSLAL